MVTWTGYELPAEPETYEALVEGFEWRLPDRYNIADAAVAAPSEAVAIHHVPDSDSDLDRVGGAADSVRSVTYGELADAAAAFAARLSAAGVGVGDRVAVCLPQCPELVVSHLAAYRLGAVVVPVSMLLGDEAFAHVLDHSDASVLVVDERRQVNDEAGLRETETYAVSVDAQPTALGGLGRVVEDGRASPPPTVDTAPDDPALILYTSGTTSEPKGVVQGHQYLLGSLPGYHCWFGLFDDRDARAARIWTPSEWAWAGALFDVVFPTLAVGGTVVSSVRRAAFDPDAALGLLAAQGVTHAFLPPTALRTIRKQTDPTPADVPDLQVVMCGGEQLPSSLAAWAETRLDVTVTEAYGQTEANALAGEVAGVPSTSSGGLGRPYPGHELRVVDETGSSVAVSETGEIAVVLPDPVVMLRYAGDPTATDAILADGLLRTGDVGRFSSDGTLSHLGRRDELIITSGYRVSPLEVETALESHPDVAAALVGSEPDDARGQRVVAHVVPATEPVDESLATDLQRHVSERLGPYKRPRRIEFVSSLPTTRTDKTDRSGPFPDR